MVQHFFLHRKFHFYLTLAVIGTTLISWFNFNSLLIMLLLACRLLDGKPAETLKAAFSNKFFLAWFAVFLLDLAGLTYTHHFFTGWKYVESKATLLAIPFILCGGPFTDKTTRNRFLSAYCGLLFLICLYCLAMAAWQFMQYRDPRVFFYHALLSPFFINAIFFSAYVLSALLFLLSSPLDFGADPIRAGWLTPSRLRQIRIGLIIFFIGMIVLLSSKLLLVLTIIILISFLYKRAAYHSGLLKRPVILLGIAAIIGTGLLAITDNPVKDRYKEMTQGDLRLYRQERQAPFTVFNGISLRLLIWRSAVEILNDQNAWIMGVSAGDAQDLLNKKYLSRINSGFLGYNFHNEYIEILVRSGLVGLFVFLAACGSLILLARSAGTKEAWFTVIIVLLLCLTESMLEMQHSAFFCCFFPLLNLPASADSAI